MSVLCDYAQPAQTKIVYAISAFSRGDIASLCEHLTALLAWRGKSTTSFGCVEVATTQQVSHTTSSKLWMSSTSMLTFCSWHWNGSLLNLCIIIINSTLLKPNANLLFGSQSQRLVETMKTCCEFVVVVASLPLMSELQLQLLLVVVSSHQHAKLHSDHSKWMQIFGA